MDATGTSDPREDLRTLLPHLADVAAGVARPDQRPIPPASPNARSAFARLLERHGLGPIGRAAFADDPELADLLAPSAIRTAAENLAHFDALARIERRLAAERIDLVVLKGAAIAGAEYADASLRPMADVDIWIRGDDIERAARAIGEEGFEPGAPPANRPSDLQKHSGGEMPFRPVRGGFGLVELHYSAFQGWWIRRTAAPDLDSVWDRAEPAAIGGHARRLSAEDAILQTAFHVAVNQFGQSPLKGTMDLAVLTRRRGIDWMEVSRRARAWRIATATWLVLETADRLVGLPGATEAIRALRPSAPRRAALRAVVDPSSVIARRDLTRPAVRYPFMIALVDRGRDGARLVGRTLWPERWWLDARYGGSEGRLGHLAALVRRGDV